MRTATIDLSAITRNVSTLIEHAKTPHNMAVVKANGYGHGVLKVAAAALAGGADWLGTADVFEALELRNAGFVVPILAWLHEVDAPFAAAILANVDIGVSSIAQLEAVAVAAATADRLAQVHLKLDTGLSRNGAAERDWPQFFAAARSHELDGRLNIRGLFSHLANTSVESDRDAIAAFERANTIAMASGLTPPLRHLASTAAGIARPAARYDMVRWGIGIYGLAPNAAGTSGELGLTPAMTLHTTVAAVRRVPAGTGVSYDHVYTTESDTNLALVPLGYADGIPRHASPGAEVSIGGSRYPVRGKIAMDQFVVEIGDDHVEIGDVVTIFGDPRAGYPSADDWATSADTINYEVVTTIGNRVTRVFGRAPQ
jgi:alanine racemase